MGLFQRQPVEIKQNLPYSLSFNLKTVLIVGLGNPGQQYAKTRHNIGWHVLDEFAAKNDFPAFKDHVKFKGFTTEKTIKQTKVILLKPGTYMNDSGQAVQAVASFHKIPPSDILAVYDELSIPFGQIRTRVGGQSAGHNGVKSLIEHIGHEFGRIRIGIKNDISDKADSSDFVLGKFNKEEQASLPALTNEAGALLTEYVYGGALPADTRTIF